jgi:hypothetical protein
MFGAASSQANQHDERGNQITTAGYSRRKMKSMALHQIRGQIRRKTREECD